jgi:hypothetical protein
MEIVELADEAGIGPEAIDLEAVVADGQPGFQARARDLVGIEEAEERFLEPAADAPTGVVLQPIETGFDDRRSSMPWIAIEERRDRDGPVDPEVFHLPERHLRRRVTFVCRQVQHGSSRRGDRNPVDDLPLVV